MRQRAGEMTPITLYRRIGGSSVAVVTFAIGATVVMTACGDDGMRGTAIPTLPPIATTSTTTTTAAPVTTMPAYYEIRRGDTLMKIASAFGLPVESIMQLNNITDPNSIQAGQIIALPPREIVATELPPTVPGQTAPTVPGATTVL